MRNGAKVPLRCGGLEDRMRQDRRPPSPTLLPLTCTGVQGFGADDERRTDGVEGEFPKVVAGFLGEDLVDHEGLVAPPGCLQLPRGGQPDLGLAMHVGGGGRPSSGVGGLAGKKTPTHQGGEKRGSGPQG